MTRKNLLCRVMMVLAFVCPMLAQYATAALPEAGKVYQFINSSYSTALTGNGPTSSVVGSTPDASDYAQLWLVQKGKSSGTFYLQNLNTAMYLTSSRNFSSPWKVVTTPTNDTDMTIDDKGSYVTVRCSADTYQCMHLDASNVLVSWTGDATASQWTIKAVSMTQEQIDAALEAAKSNSSVAEDVTAIQTALDAIFKDKACTELQTKYASMSATQLAADANYKALPEALQKMVTKVQSDNWAETDATSGKDWDSTHAKKFRVQSYEPYSRGSEAAEMVGIQAYTNMNNPTGIVTRNRQALYVMVNNAPKTGATLTINGAVGSGMYNDWSAGVELKEGLNIIPIWEDGAAQYIYYTVDTYNNGKRSHKLTDFDDIKIHIEGGALNGFYNYLGDDLYTPDTNEDWLYYRERATHPMFDLVGQYVILHFFLDQVMTKVDGGYLTDGLKQVLAPGKNFDLKKIMTAWDDFCFAERLLIGLQPKEDILSDRAKGYFAPFEPSDVAPDDFYLYFNNRMMGITMQGDLFMNATSWRTAYNPSTMSTILLDLPNDSGSLWGPAHEYGHMNQAPMKFAGTTEISNNIFSNVAIFYQGITTSRADYPSVQRDIFNRNKTYLEHGTWGTTRMFWQLFLYYHVQGHNKKFYPTLYELLRQNPRQQSYYLNPRYDMLHFAKMCCQAAGEDLTEFFEAWGFFVPLKDYAIDDYSQFIANLTLADIEAVKGEIAAMNLPANHAMLFIDDRPGSDRKTHSEFDKTKCGKLGGLKDFAANTKPDGKHIYTIAGTTITVSGGEGGVGFLGHDASGKLITFANDLSWTLNNDAAAKLATGQGKLYAVAADGTLTEVPNAIHAGTAAQKANVANSMLQAVKSLIDFADPTMTKVGWYRADRLTDLISAYDQAKEIASSDPEKAYDLLVAEYYKVLVNEFAKISVRAGNSYRMINRRYTDKALVAGLNNAVSRTPDASNDIHKWLFEDAGDGAYYLYNVKQGKYLQDVKRSQVVEMGTEPVQKYTMVETAPGYYAFAAAGNESYCLHIDQSSNVVGWSSNEEPSQWQVVLAEVDEVNAAKERLEELVANTNDLLDRAGTVEVNESKITLGQSNMWSNARCRETTYGDQFKNWNVLFDNNTSTFFHSDYSAYGSTDGLDHYLQVDLGAGNEQSVISFTYTTRGDGQVHAPTSITVYASNDGVNTQDKITDWTEITTISTDLPVSANTVYTSAPINAGKPYRHYRFMVTANSSGSMAQGHPYFVMSEFGMSKAEIIATPSTSWPAVTEEMLINAYTAKSSAESVLNSSNSTVDDVDSAYDVLEPAYLALLNAMDPTSIKDIIDTTVGTAADDAIYDLTGRRVNSITRPGIYIVGGRKLLVK